MELAIRGWRACCGRFRGVALGAVGRLLGLAAVLAGACTFYTGQPGPLPSNNDAAGASALGGGPGLSGAGAGLSQADAGEAGVPSLPVWVDVTGNLVGRSESGGVVFLSAKPDENKLIAGIGADGLWASTDGGQTWKALGQSGSSDLITNRVSSIVYDPDHSQVFWETGIYVGDGLYRTSDDGKTIVVLGTGTVRHNDLVSVDFSDPKRQTLLVGGHEESQMIYLSTDGGKTWTKPGSAIPDGTGYSSFPLILDSQTFLLGTSNQILRSADGGGSWTIVSKSGGNGAPVQTPDGSIYWLIDGVPVPQPASGIMRSTDQGRTWERVVGAGVLNGILIGLPDGSLASETNTNIIVSRDQGMTWTVVTTALPFVPKGLTYSNALRAFFIWTDSSEPKIPINSIARYDWDYETE